MDYWLWDLLLLGGGDVVDGRKIEFFFLVIVGVQLPLLVLLTSIVRFFFFL